MTARWVSPKQASEHVGVHVETVAKALREGELRGYQRKPNGRWRIAIEDVDAWIKGEPPANTAAPTITRRSA